MGAPIKGRADYWSPGDWNASCSLCGRKRKASKMTRNWQGLYRCPEHDEPRHPQDFARGLPDNMGVPWSQPQQDTFTIIEIPPDVWKIIEDGFRFPANTRKATEE